MKILLSAFACGATQTSEPGVAWRAVHRALGDGHDVWAIIQRSLWERELQAHLAAHPLPGFHPVFFDLPEILVKLLRRRGPINSIYYHWWQHNLARFARELHRQVGFDLAHHVTFARYWSPSGVRDLGIPFIWGPVGAAESAPPAFLAEMGWRDWAFEFTRDNVRAISQYAPSVRATAQAASIAIGTTRESCEKLHLLGAKRVEQMPMSLSDEAIKELDGFPAPSDGPFRVLCLGRLLHWKGFDLAIRAFSIFARSKPDAELWIVGSGPYQQELEKEAAQSGLASQIHLIGQVSHEVAMEKLAQAHVLMHPALHENFPGVILEAMAAGRPVICFDIGGPAIQVTPECGFIIPATNPKDSVINLAAALTRLDDDRGLLAKMSTRARARVRQEFTVGRNGARMRAFYAEAVEDFAGRH